MAREIGHNGLTKLHVVRSMHQRKTLMADLADAFIALPGGYGTFEEFFEAVTWTQLGIHTKPCGLLNVDGYYDALLALLDRAVADGFIQEKNRQLVIDAPDVPTLLQKTGSLPPGRGRARDRQSRAIKKKRRQPVRCLRLCAPELITAGAGSPRVQPPARDCRCHRAGASRPHASSSTV